MNKIIKAVEFKTKKHGEDWVETSQSNSTTTLISITLLQLMMKEVMNQDIETSLPLIIDEVAHIDESEFPWLIRNIENNGFRLLSASTNNISVYTLEEIGTECCIDEFKASKVYSAGRVNVFFGAEGCLND
jgi:replication-associated recombination protein RarA